ncbi:hypothetical protein F4806DRAFT_483925 [Annulohypoxylon nitens]|nr:hypothetical protein F4806DRAFT_483925 [Annulohypoxylon nitens]
MKDASANKRSLAMADEVRPTPKQFRETYNAAFQAWENLHLRIVENSNLPPFCLTKDTFHQHPYFPPNLRLKHVHPARKAGLRRLYATGSSVWDSPPCKDDIEFSSFKQRLEIEVAVSSPVSLFIATDEPSQEDSRNPPWFVRADTNFVPILILAWAYILSTRWTELLTEDCSLSYTDSQAERMDDLPGVSTSRSANYVDIGTATWEETRWWTAVLAPRQGWRSVVTGQQHMSPWSISLQPSPAFVLRTITSMPPPSSPRPSAVSSSAAIRFLDCFCLRHNILDQSHVALAAVLLFPCFGRNRPLLLPQPKLGTEKQPAAAATYQEDLSEHQLWSDWLGEEHDLDRLLTLSCNIRGIRPMLLSVFYEPWIDCNLVTPWLQGTVAAIDSVAHGRPYILGYMLMEREPSVAALWAGAVVLGLQQPLLEEVRRGQIPADLHSAIWSETAQSFLQQPVSNPLVAHGHVSRADECRLLFLSQSGQHKRVPICQWRPFGRTPVEDVDLDVRIHEECENHRLQYRGFTWDCINGKPDFQSPNPTTRFHSTTGFRPTTGVNMGRQIFVRYDGLNRDKEAVSENATRSIFGWLRFDGYTRHEKDIWEHEWFHVLRSDSDEDEIEDEDKSVVNVEKDITPIKNWLSGVQENTNAVV